MRHNIVHFTGDAGAFVLRGEAAFLLLLVFEAAGAFFELFAAQFAHAAGVAEEPEDGEDGSAEHAEHQGDEDAGGHVVPVVEERERGLHGNGECADPAENEGAEAGAAGPVPAGVVGGEADRRVAGDDE